MLNKDNSCRFCDLSLHTVMDTDEHAASFLDAYPVVEFHTLFIPRRHVLTYFDLTKEEYASIFDLVEIQRKRILDQDPTVEGFNVGWNCGKAAGQTVFRISCSKKGEKVSRETEGVQHFHPWVDSRAGKKEGINNPEKRNMIIDFTDQIIADRRIKLLTREGVQE